MGPKIWHVPQLPGDADAVWELYLKKHGSRESPQDFAIETVPRKEK